MTRNPSDLKAPLTSGDLAPAAPSWMLRVLKGPLLAYLGIALLQLKVMWGMWQYAELEAGDTTFYFMDGLNFAQHGKINIAWSPLYTMSLGLLVKITGNAFAVLVASRMLIALTATLLVLAVARKMLPPLLAWLVAAWWAVLPIAYGTLYAVHLFAVLPVLSAWVAAVRLPRPWNRGAALAILAVTTALARNELLVATGCWALFCMIWEFRDRRRARLQRRSYPKNLPLPVTVLAVYGAPLLSAALLVGFFYARSYIRYPVLTQVMQSKHQVNMGQVYAFGYAQRTHDTKLNPWTGYQDLLVRDFGTPEVTLGQMVRTNPRAMLAHVWWNTRLTPAGVQLLLFNAISGDETPDYQPAVPEPLRVRILSGLCIFVVLLAVVLGWRRRRVWWRAWIAPRAAGWLVMAAVLMTAGPIIATQRPRPSYLLAHGIALMTVIATATLIVVHTLSRYFRRFRPRTPTAMAAIRGVRWVAAALVGVLIIMLAENGYAPGRGPDNKPLARPARPLFDLYDRLLPYQNVIARPDTFWFLTNYGQEMRHFLGQGHCRTADMSVLKEMRPDEDLTEYFDRAGINLVYLDPPSASQVVNEYSDLLSEFLRMAPKAGWKVAGASTLPATRQTAAVRWVMLWKPRPLAGLAPPPLAGDYSGLSPLDDQRVFAGFRVLSGLGGTEGPYPQFASRIVRWGYGPKTRLSVRVTDGDGPIRYGLMIEGLCGLENQTVTVRVDGQLAGTIPWGPAGRFYETSWPLTLSPGTHELELAYSIWQEPAAGIKLAMLYRRLEMRPAGSSEPQKMNDIDCVR